MPLGRGETILVVEDEPEVRDLTLTILKSLSYRVLEAADGHAALERLRSEPKIDLVLSDVVLPGGLGGRHICDAVARERPSIKVILMSGYAEDSAIGGGSLDPDQAFIQKPFQKSHLARMIRQALDPA